MPRRCLECDVVRDDGPACPACGSSRTLIIGAAGAQDERYDDAGWLLLAQGLAATYATDAAPGLILGSAWFMQACCALLLLGGVEFAPRTARSVVAAVFLVHLPYLGMTPQALFIGLGALLQVCVLIRLHTDKTPIAVRAALPAGILLVAAIAGGALSTRLGWTPPAWWEGRHPMGNAPAKAVPPTGHRP